VSEFDPMNPQAAHMADASMVRTLALQADAIWPQEAPIFARHPLPPGGAILDVGCGTGEISVRLAAAFPAAAVTGVDLVEAHLERARATGAAHADRLRFTVANAFDLPFDAGTFDLVVCRHLVQAVPQPERIVAEMLRVAKPGGRLHLLAEDYGMIFAHPTRLDADRFWAEGPRRFAAATGTDLHVGRAAFTLLRRAGATDVRVDYVAVDTLRVPRATFAAILLAWKDGYAASVAAHTRFTLGEVEAHFDDLVAAIRDPEGFALWLIPIVTGAAPKVD
jgi:SAM-dependent methyltransferase